MTRIGTLREEFDRDMDFEAVKTFKFDGKEYTARSKFDKTQVTTRLLRQLYDGRYLRMVQPDNPVVREEREPPKVEIGYAAEAQAKSPRVKRVKLQQGT